jgi:hypothetical protein
VRLNFYVLRLNEQQWLWNSALYERYWTESHPTCSKKKECMHEEDWSYYKRVKPLKQKRYMLIYIGDMKKFYFKCLFNVNITTSNWSLWIAVFFFWQLAHCCFPLCVSDFSELFRQLNSVQGSLDAKRSFVRDIAKEALRFKRQTLASMLRQFEETLAQAESDRGKSWWVGPR